MPRFENNCPPGMSGNDVSIETVERTTKSRGKDAKRSQKNAQILDFKKESAYYLSMSNQQRTFRSHEFVENPDVNVLEAALNRIRYLFERYERIVVSYSGGKDSTVSLFLALRVAKEYDRLPLDVLWFDDELIDPDTVNMTTMISQMPEINFHWLCVPIRHSLRSVKRPFWWTWNPSEEWARPMPPTAITMDDYPHHWPKATVKPNGFAENVRAYGRSQKWENYVQIAGIRTQEAFNRSRAIINGGDWIVDEGFSHYSKPIYDWTVADVWLAIKTFKMPYSGYYDKISLFGVSMHAQRVAPWGNVAAAKETKLYQQMYPDFWNAAIRRLPELKTQQNLGGTRAIKEVVNKPLGMTWREYTYMILAAQPEASRKAWINHIRAELLRWSRSHSDEIPYPEEPLIYTGPGGIEKKAITCWKKLATAAGKNDTTMRDRA